MSATDGESNTLDGGDEPIIVDCDVLEAAKENIQPLAAGRRVTALQAILSTPHAQRESRLTAARQRLRINVEIALEDDEDDPLEAYCRFVHWVVENYPQGHSAESGLLELLEEATRVLKDDRDGKWRDDIRYLKLWVLYASYVEKPAIIFKFCMVNEIGTSHVLLYEEFAIALERAGRKTAADETYLLGIARRATPIERLESKYHEFQKRMMSSVSHPSADSEPEPAPAPSHTNSSRRKVLGETSSSKATRTSHSVVNRENEEDVFTLPASTSGPRPNARLPIFMDPSGVEEQDASAAPWPELGTRKSRIKENIKEASKAGGTTLRQAIKKAGRSEKIAIYRDMVPDASVEEQEELEPGMDSPSMLPPPPPPVAAPIKKRSASSSKISVFRDEEPESDSLTQTALPLIAALPEQKKGRVTRSSSKAAEETPAVLPTEQRRATRASARLANSTGSKGQEAALSSTKPKSTRATASSSKLVIFRDEREAPVLEPTASSSTTVYSSTKKASVPKPTQIAVFRDEEVAGASMGTKKGKTSASKTKMAVSCDDEPESERKAVAPAKMVVFRDEEFAADQEANSKFIPYKDEDVRTCILY
ncbi:hypothetical protein EW026_g1645 [Hermanssonia centrifuga]|uniref:BUB1 N-terminal domain-containing protein n=1 Tax=Hermanssonia centrifuga TaxID=98765 RepID=A0A4V3XB91_9APHY|nr:hypothetical protein EW026_g1645 [Hermanssonia centrifuga]